MNSEKTGNFILSLFIIMLGLLFTLSPVYKIGRYVAHNSQSVETVGVVVKSGEDVYFGCKPFLEFYDENKKKVEIRSNINYNLFFCPQIGERIRLLYNKEKPQDTMVVSSLRNIFIPCLILTIGIFFLYSAFSGRISGK